MKNFQFYVLALATSACTLFLSACGRPQAAPSAMPPSEVATITVTQQPVTLTTELPGRTSPYVISEIRPQVSGLIQKRLFTEGSDVTAGQPLYQIDPATYQAALDNAQAALGRAEANLPAIQAREDRYKEALADKAVSKQDFDDAQSALKQAQAEVEIYKASVKTAKINLEYTNVIAPISGRIGKSAVTDGAIVMAYQAAALTSIQQLDPIYVDVPQSTKDLLRLRKRLETKEINRDKAEINKVQLVLEDGTKYSLEGQLQFQDISVDSTTGSVILRMVFSNSDKILLPGMFVRAIVQEGTDEKAILIPQQSVSRDTKGNPMALAVNASGTVEIKMLELDRAIGDQWLVSSGLQPGDHIIVEGSQRIHPGASVKEVPFAQKEETQNNLPPKE